MQAQLRIASNSVDAERKKPFGVIIPYYPHDWISGNQTPNGSELLCPVVWSTGGIIHETLCLASKLLQLVTTILQSKC